MNSLLFKPPNHSQQMDLCELAPFHHLCIYLTTLSPKQFQMIFKKYRDYNESKAKGE